MNSPAKYPTTRNPAGKVAASSRLILKAVWVRSFVPKLKSSAVSAISPTRRAERGD